MASFILEECISLFNLIFLILICLCGLWICFLSEHSQCVGVNYVNFNIILLVHHKVIAYLYFCLLCILMIARVGMRKITLLSMRMIQWLIQSSPWTGSGVWSCSGGFCDNQFSLQLNVNKTKEMVIDFRRSPPSPVMTTIKSLDIEIIDTHKYFVLVIDNKLRFQPNFNQCFGCL